MDLAIHTKASQSVNTSTNNNATQNASPQSNSTISNATKVTDWELSELDRKLSKFHVPTAKEFHKKTWEAEKREQRLKKLNESAGVKKARELHGARIRKIKQKKGVLNGIRQHTGTASDPPATLSVLSTPAPKSCLAFHFPHVTVREAEDKEGKILRDFYGSLGKDSS